MQGELRTSPFRSEVHGYIAGKILVSAFSFVSARKLGRVYVSTVFLLASDPDTVLAPDVAFVRADRVRKGSGFIEGAPDVAVDIAPDVNTADYLRGGARAVVIVDPSTSTVRIHRPSGVTTVADSIELPDILPGWSLPLSELFD